MASEAKTGFQWHKLNDDAQICFHNGWTVAAYVLLPHGVGCGGMELFRLGERIDFEPLPGRIEPMSPAHFQMAEELLVEFAGEEVAGGPFNA